VRGADVLVQVEDDGIGLAQEAIGRVFELFAQGRTVGDGPRNGLGIGLSVVRRLVELHGGSVGASSEGVGRGTRFDVHLPLAAPAARPVPATPGEPGVVRLFGDSPRILVVDDNRDAADSLSTLLRVKGYQVSVAYDGEGAVSAFDATQPSVVLLDLGLPDASGDQVALRLRAAARWPVRFIAITGWGQPRDRERTAAAGFEAHLVKPVDPGEVLRLLEVDGTRPSGIGSTAGPTD
jgi:CheY-like chemotaxis protein